MRVRDNRKEQDKGRGSKGEIHKQKKSIEVLIKEWGGDVREAGGNLNIKTEKLLEKYKQVLYSYRDMYILKYQQKRFFEEESLFNNCECPGTVVLKL